MRKKILILGGGFGGVYTAHYLLKLLKLEEAEITLVSKNNFFLFVPMLHEVATGNIRVHNVVHPIREILRGKNFKFFKSTINEIDLNKKKVKTTVGDFDYDYLVVSLGSQTNYYGMPGSENCLTLKGLHDAYHIRNHVIDMFEQAFTTRDKKEQEKLLTFVVVGGGPTGVELVAELADWIFKNFKKEYEDCLDYSKVHLKLLNPGDKVLKGVNEHLRDFTMKTLKKKGVDLVMGAKAKAVGKDFVEYDHNGKKKKLPASTIIWTAGVRPIDIEVKGVERERGIFPVDSCLRVEGFDNVYALGDMAGYINPKTGNRPPPTAQLAHKASKVVARNIAAAVKGKEQKPFIYKSGGFLASLGKGQAIAHVNGLKFHGFFAWWLWRTIYLSKLIGFENKLRVAIDWTFDLFFTRDTSQV